MVKRVILSGQAKDRFFSHPEMARKAEDKKEATPEKKDDKSSNKANIPPKVPSDFIAKINNLKKLLHEFKSIVGDEEFGKLKVKNFREKN